MVKTSAGWNYLDGTSDLGGAMTVTGATLSASCYGVSYFGYANPEKQLMLSQYDNPRLYSILADLCKKYEGPHVETIRVKTFLNVWQKDFKEGDNIPLDRNLMFQKV